MTESASGLIFRCRLAWSSGMREKDEKITTGNDGTAIHPGSQLCAVWTVFEDVELGVETESGM